jgi:hypothetical protein
MQVFKVQDWEPAQEQTEQPEKLQTAMRGQTSKKIRGHVQRIPAQVDVRHLSKLPAGVVG